VRWQKKNEVGLRAEQLLNQKSGVGFFVNVVCGVQKAVKFVFMVPNKTKM
jgi:uncharacterized membrane protein YeaQ/YmgE (transglycosylase-associated protein family)